MPRPRARFPSPGSWSGQPIKKGGPKAALFHYQNGTSELALDRYFRLHFCCSVTLSFVPSSYVTTRFQRNFFALQRAFATLLFLSIDALNDVILPVSPATSGASGTLSAWPYLAPAFDFTTRPNTVGVAPSRLGL